MSMILSRVDCSESRDEIISSVQNQKFQEATRSITPITSTTNRNSFISQSWTTVLTGLYFIYGTLLPPLQFLQVQT